MMFTEECRKTHKATDDDMKLIMEGKIPESKEAKCTMTCTIKQFKMVIIFHSQRIEDFAMNICFELNQAEEKDGQLQFNVENMVKMAEANGISKEKCAILEDVANKCKAPKTEDE